MPQVNQDEIFADDKIQAFQSSAAAGRNRDRLCMVYVELDPIRARIAKTSEASVFTGVKSEWPIVASHRCWSDWEDLSGDLVSHCEGLWQTLQCRCRHTQRIGRRSSKDHKSAHRILIRRAVRESMASGSAAGC